MLCYDGYDLQGMEGGGSPSGNVDLPYGLVDRIHDIAKNIFIGACVYHLGDSAAAGAATAIGLTALDTVLGKKDSLQTARCFSHLAKELGIGVLFYGLAMHSNGKPMLRMPDPNATYIGSLGPVGSGIWGAFVSSYLRMIAKGIDSKL